MDYLTTRACSAPTAAATIAGCGRRWGRNAVDVRPAAACPSHRPTVVTVFRSSIPVDGFTRQPAARPAQRGPGHRGTRPTTPPTPTSDAPPRTPATRRRTTCTARSSRWPATTSVSSGSTMQRPIPYRTCSSRSVAQALSGFRGEITTVDVAVASAADLTVTAQVKAHLPGADATPNVSWPRRDQRFWLDRPSARTGWRRRLPAAVALAARPRGARGFPAGTRVRHAEGTRRPPRRSPPRCW